MKTFKDLSKKDKIEHIWYYYKRIIISSIIGIILFTYLTLDYINKVDYVLNISLMAANVDTAKEEALEQDLTNIMIGENPGKKRAGIVDYQLGLTNENPSVHMAQNQKFIVQLNAGTIDLTIMCEDVYQDYKDKQIFVDLTKIDDFSSKAYEMIDNYFISLDKSTKIKGIIKSSQKLYIAIPVTAKDREKSIKCLKYLLK